MAGILAMSAQTVVTISGALANNKVYDGTTAATVNFTGAVLNGVASGDAGNVSLVTNGYVATFSDKNVDSGKTVTVSGLTLQLTGSAVGNYTLAQPVLNANITAYSLTVYASAESKTYDATTDAEVDLSDNSINGDDVYEFYDTASFADKNVGTNKPVTVTDIFVAGTDSGNYTLGSTTATALANITSKLLQVGATGTNKPYDGTLSASVKLVDTHYAGDKVVDTYASATFADQYVGNGIAINVTGIAISGTDAPNYTLNATTARAHGNITPRTLNVTATGQNKTYDGTTNATIANLTGDQLTGDDVAVGFTSAAFVDKNVGTNKTVNVYGIVITGTDSDSYVAASSDIITTANISSRALNVVAIGGNKTYDGGTNTTAVTLSDNHLAGDSLTDAYTNAWFNDKNVGDGKLVNVSGITVTGPNAGNYTVGNPTATTSGNIIPCGLLVTAQGRNKAYDGTTNATVTLTDNHVSGDSVTDSYASAGFSDPNAGTGKAVTVVGIQVTGNDAANYTLTSTTATTTANITGATLTVAATGVTKTYDGTTNASVGLSDNRVAGDTFTVGYTKASFSDKRVGSGKTITVAGLTLSGTSSANYTLASTNLSTTADITPASLTVSAEGVNKVYDGTTKASVSLGDNRVAGDSLTDNYGSANFTDPGVGNGKTVNVASIYISGTDAGNYTLNDTSASTTADILMATTTPAALVSSENPSGYRDAIAFTETLPADATGTVAYFTNGIAFNSGSVVNGAFTSTSISNLLRGTNVITAWYSGDGNYASVTNVLGQIVTNHPPVTGYFSFSVTNGLSLKVRITNLLSAVVDPDGDSISLVSVSASTNGMPCYTNSTFILFQNTNYLNDRFSYVVTDGFGGYATGQVAVASVVMPFTGQNANVTINGGTNLVTCHGIPGYTYVVQRSVNLLTWVNISTNTAPLNGVINVTDTFSDLSGAPASAFYRLYWRP
jgi:hypothetical protein